MITGLNESKILTKHIPCECKCKFNVIQINGRCECKKRHVCEKDYVWNLATCNRENGKCLANSVHDSAITYDEIIKPCNEETKKNFNKF